MGRIYKTVILKNGNKQEHVVGFVDSGADITVISERLARRLNVKLGAPSSLMVADGRVLATKTGKIRVEVPDEKVRIRLNVDITDIPFDEDIDILDMILGIDFLQESESRLVFHRTRKKGARRATA
jgi:predicted aspartyl protease